MNRQMEIHTNLETKQDCYKTIEVACMRLSQLEGKPVLCTNLADNNDVARTLATISASLLGISVPAVGIAPAVKQADEIKKAYERGESDGYDQGYSEGYADGHAEGYNEGHDDGYDEAVDEMDEEDDDDDECDCPMCRPAPVAPKAPIGMGIGIGVPNGTNPADMVRQLVTLVMRELNK